MPEDRPTISSARLTAGEVARHSFLTVRRGFDPKEVRSFLETVARELATWEQREQDLRRHVSEAEHRARNPVLDEATLSAALGQQSAQVLRSAHEEAARILRQSEESAAALLHEAQRQANDVQIRAESASAERIAEAELNAAAIRQQVQQQAEAAQASTRVDAESMLTQARTQGRDMLEQAQAARKRVLADMAQRRHAMHIQIEQFRAARDELAAAVVGVRESVDRIVGDLSQADDDARNAASRVARRPPPPPGLAPEELTLLEEHDIVLGPDEELAAAVAAQSGVAVEEGSGDVVLVDVEEVGEASPETGPTEAVWAGAVSTEAGPTEAGPTGGGGAPVPEEGSAAAGPTATSDEGGGEAAAGQSGTVEELFARIRSSRERGPGDVDPGGAGEAAGSPQGGDRTEGVEAGPVATGSAAPDDAQEPPGALAPPVGMVDEETDEVKADAATDRALLQARSASLDPVIAALSRRLKRELQDDQNRLLDRIRSGSSRVAALVPEDEQRMEISDAAVGQLTDAYDSGVDFAHQHGASGTASKERPAVIPLSQELAETIVVQLRRRLEGEGGASEDANETVGAAYREWRGERIERLVGDYVVAAFSSGVIDAGAPGLRWVVGADGPACADCEDNSLAGAVAPGEEFPTGHRHPPAHPGCRCLVTPTSA